jgi:hypothetical protein
LLHLEPTLGHWEADARSIARNAEWSWYPRWLPHCAAFRRDLHQLAERHGLDFEEIHRAAVGALLDCYAIERPRRERRPA